jgi:hypothetical protein
MSASPSLPVHGSAVRGHASLPRADPGGQASAAPAGHAVAPDQGLLRPPTVGMSDRGTLLSMLELAVLRTVAYSDLFDYPLRPDEIHRYLIGLRAPLSAVRDVLRGEHLVPHRLCGHRGHVTLPDRQAIIETRLHRAQVADRLWPQAVRYGRAIGALPFVHMVAVTGTLAMDNVDADADVDYLIITSSHRLWLARLLTVALVHVGHLERLTICPNYVIGLASLSQFRRSLFAAHELAQMVPVYGLETYRQLIEVNAWAEQFLPNAFGTIPDQRVQPLSSTARVFKRAAELALSGRLGEAWEGRESRSKIRQLSQQAATRGSGAVTFTSQVCKGHLEDHGSQTAQAYAQRLARLGLDPLEAEELLGQGRSLADREASGRS